MKALGAGCFGQGVGCVFCPSLPQSKEKKSTTLKVETPFSVLKKKQTKNTTKNQNNTPPKQKPHTTLSQLFHLFNVMCQSEYVLSKFNIFFSHVASVTCASQNYTMLTSSLATKKAHLIAQVPVTYLQFPGLPLLLFLEEGKKNGQKRNRNL